MRLHQILVTIFSLTGVAHAGCYQHGEFWGDDKQFALSLADQACGEGGRLLGRYRKGDKRDVCQNRSGRHIKLHIGRLPTESPIVPDYGDMILKKEDDCKKIKLRIDSCDKGGKEPELENVYLFKADINMGNCEKEIPPKV
ncbi:hypothetical protein F4779DRAFT_623653 [Xylariaceae sp. FL0662B]|nr:hypothetical protein F4779DRAFT_623653 [Xylariaceae sp. FL0662B]